MEFSPRKIGLFVLFVIWAAVLAGIVTVFDIQLKLADPLSMAYAVLVFLIIHVLWAWNWKSLNEAVGLKGDYVTLFKGTFISGFTDAVSPQLLPSAELATSYYLKKKFGGKLADYFPVVALEANIIFIFQVLILLFASVLIGGEILDAVMLLEDEITEIGIYVGGAIVFFLSVLLVLWKFREKIFKDTLKISFGKMDVLNNAIDNIYSLSVKHPWVVLRVAFVNLFLLVLEGSVVYFLLGMNSSFLLVLIAFMAGRLVTLVSMVPGGFGVRQVVLSGFLSIGGVPVNQLMNMIIVYDFIFLWFNIFLGGYLTGSEIYNWVTTLGEKRIEKEFQEVRFKEEPK